ncbi:MAG: helix-turn-helix transcriptional regulator [bacterium]|nr:helix-turn-helix transcriptional regulator [bacterium]
MTKKKINKALDFQDILSQKLKDPEFKNSYDEYGKQLEIAYKILELRKKRKMSQKELAEKIGTTQSNIARMESGQQNFTTNTLSKIAIVFKCDLQVNFVKN